MTALFTVTGLRRSYGRLQAVDGIDLAIEAGCRHALIGCNGAGKTTLLHMLAGTIRVTAGRIEYDGANITQASPAARARAGIARSFQTPAVFDTLSILENLILGASPHVRTRRWRPGTRRAELAARSLEQLEPLGLADHAHKTAGELSHGQRRLLEIAMALVASPRLLLLDEPAAGLTDTDMARLRDCLGQLPADLTVVLVEHHQDLVAAIADVVTVLHEGRVLTQGTPAQVAAHPLVAEVYLGTGAST